MFAPHGCVDTDGTAPQRQKETKKQDETEKKQNETIKASSGCAWAHEKQPVFKCVTHITLVRAHTHIISSRYWHQQCASCKSRILLNMRPFVLRVCTKTLKCWEERVPVHYVCMMYDVCEASCTGTSTST